MISQAVVKCTLCIKLFFQLCRSAVMGFITESYAHTERIMRYGLIK